MDEVFGEQKPPRRDPTVIPNMTKDEAIHIRAIELAIESFGEKGIRSEADDELLMERAEKMRKFIERGF